MEEAVSVAELTQRFKVALEQLSLGVWVQGEVGALTRAASGHVYFTLKDEKVDAILECVMYRFPAQRARRVLEQGARVALWGKATVWAPRGRLQFIAEQAKPFGRGALLEALDQLKERLGAEGLFASGRKRALPENPSVIGVVTSADGAAFEDIRTVAFRRGRVKLVLCPALVQGEAAPLSIIAALDLIERYAGLEVVIVGRGGGSFEDLMAFNDERVVRRVAALRVPVVSAVGHEVDFTLCDLVADARAATPSQAAELLVGELSQVEERLRRERQRLTRAVLHHLQRERHRVTWLRLKLSDPRFIVAQRQQDLDALEGRLAFAMQRQRATQRLRLELSLRRLLARHPRAVLGRARAELAPLRTRLVAAMTELLAAQRGCLELERSRLQGLSPLSVLGRGYALVTTPTGGIVSSARQVAVGSRLSIRLGDGTLEADVAGRRHERGEP